MYEDLGIDWLSPLQASAVFGIVVGLLFGASALYTNFCIRRALVSADASTRSSALAVWATAFGVAVVGTQLAVLAGWIDFSEHRLHSASIPFALIIIGGLLFGAGMVLTRGCASRLAVLTGTGNLRALFVIVIFAITAHATLKGILSPLRISLAEFVFETSINEQLVQSQLSVWAIVLLLVAAVVLIIRRSQVSKSHIMVAALIGALVPIAWVGTGFVLLDDFDPIVFQSLSFTSPSSEWLFWGIASTSIGAGFGVGLLSGVVVGSASVALTTAKFKWQSFTSPRETGRYSLGAVLMGIGGVFAGGCTVGAGMSGVASLSISAMLALVFIVIGARVTNAILIARAKESSSLVSALI